MAEARTLPVQEWQGTMATVRREFTTAWEAEPGSSRGAAAAIAAMRATFERSVADWESLSHPDTHAPPTAERALSDFVSLADHERVAAAPRIRENNNDEAVEFLVRSIRASLDLEMVNDLAVMLHAVGRFEDAIGLFTLILLVDPTRDDARDNLSALLGRDVP